MTTANVQPHWTLLVTKLRLLISYVTALVCIALFCGMLAMDVERVSRV